MPMGIVSDADFEREVDNSRNDRVIIPPPVIEAEVVELPNKGRKEGDNNVPDSLRKIIGETAVTEGRPAALQIAEEFGLSPSSVSAYSNGSTSTASMDSQPNLDHLNEARGRITNKAIKKMVKAIDCLTDEKLAEAKPDTLANVARTMGAIVKDMEPEKPKNPGDKDKPVFIFYSPQFRKEEHFEHIFVQDKA